MTASRQKRHKAGRYPVVNAHAKHVETVAQILYQYFGPLPGQAWDKLHAEARIPWRNRAHKIVEALRG